VSYLKGMSIQLYHKTAQECNTIVTKRYSTSFSLGIKMLGKQYQKGIFGIYGYVRLGDEIVDSFHDYDRQLIWDEFERDTWLALERGISPNPIINTFVQVVKKYNIHYDLIKAFHTSMKLDLEEQKYDPALFEKYIHGSAEVVGLMCLKVFCDGHEEMYERLTLSAKKLGSALQKVNFLRDIKDDFALKGRTYFPNLDFSKFDKKVKDVIEDDIQQEFDEALEGIKQLPDGSRIGVYVAYKYYVNLFRKIKRKKPQQVLKGRIRINNALKLFILTKSFARYKLNLL
jgi:15-cis-phytoene synthase